MASRVSPKNCKITDCERTRHAYGHCSMHSRRLLKTGSVGSPQAKAITIGCKFGSCKNRHDSHGYCANHARQYRKYGHPLSKEEKSKHLSEANSKKGKGITPTNRLERTRFTKSVGLRVMERDNYTCQICNKQSRYLHVDHIKPWSDYVELRFEADNCRTVCRPCHYYVTFKRKMPFDSRWGIKTTERRTA